MFQYDELLPMSSGGKMADEIPEVTFVFIKRENYRSTFNVHITI
jgi:hypothetical protein